MDLATLRLFKAVQIEKHGSKGPDKRTLKATIPFGYVLDPAVTPSRRLLKTVNDLVGVSGEQANAAFHKSWEKVRSADIEQLVVEQLVHYFTTYGYASLGAYDPSTVYIPNEKLELPEIADNLSLTLIRGLTAPEILGEIVKLGGGVALHEQSLDDVMAIVKANRFPPDYLDAIGNHELLARLYDFYGLVPDDPVAFLRYLVYRLTETSLLIKNDELIKKIKEADSKKRRILDKLIANAPADLASIFYRFKPLFLALKSVSKDKTFFNRLRKKAVKLHQPLPVDYLNSVTEQIKRGSLDLDELARRVGGASVFRKVRLAYALHFRLNASKSVVYPVRNGLGWATDFDWPEGLEASTTQALDVVLRSLTEDLRPNVEGKTVFIPDCVDYAIPSSEKQFAGPFPFGSYVATPRDMVFGVHWFNVGDRSIDLDLSLLSAEGKVGWDAAYRNQEALFSGDMTDAPPPTGATELFYVRDGVAPNLVMCNYYNYSSAVPVEAKVLVAQEAPSELTENYMVDANHIVAKAGVPVTRTQTVLGLVLTVQGQTRFYFGNVSVGCGISATNVPHAGHARDYLTDRFTNPLSLTRLLESAGAKPVATRPSEGDYIDLSPENLEKSSIIALFQPAASRHDS